VSPLATSPGIRDFHAFTIPTHRRAVAARPPASARAAEPPAGLDDHSRAVQARQHGGPQQGIPAFYALFEKAGVGASRLGLLPFSGDQTTSSTSRRTRTYAAMETTSTRMDDVFAGSAGCRRRWTHSPSGPTPCTIALCVMIAVRRKNELSYRPLAVTRVAKSRFVILTVTRVNAWTRAAGIRRPTSS
jgi:hypothetical protein